MSNQFFGETGPISVPFRRESEHKTARQKAALHEAAMLNATRYDTGSYDIDSEESVSNSTNPTRADSEE